MSYKSTIYSAQNIEVLLWNEAIRKRPGMYIQGDPKFTIEFAVRLLVANCVARFAPDDVSSVIVDLAGPQIRVTDDGAGIPFDRKSVDEINGFCRNLSGGLHGLGYGEYAPWDRDLAILNALSDSMVFESWHNRKRWRVAFGGGDRIGGPEIIESGDGQGNTVTWRADESVLPNQVVCRSSVRAILHDVAHLNAGLTIDFEGERIRAERGLMDLAWVRRTWAGDRTEIHLVGDEDGLKYEVALLGACSADTLLQGWCNGRKTPGGGSHVDAVRGALQGQGYDVGLVHVIIDAPRYKDQLRSQLVEPALRSRLETIVRAAL